MFELRMLRCLNYDFDLNHSFTVARCISIYAHDSFYSGLVGKHCAGPIYIVKERDYRQIKSVIPFKLTCLNI